MCGLDRCAAICASFSTGWPALAREGLVHHQRCRLAGVIPFEVAGRRSHDSKGCLVKGASRAGVLLCSTSRLRGETCLAVNDLVLKRVDLRQPVRQCGRQRETHAKEGRTRLRKHRRSLLATGGRRARGWRRWLVQSQLPKRGMPRFFFLLLGYPLTLLKVQYRQRYYRVLY